MQVFEKIFLNFLQTAICGNSTCFLVSCIQFYSKVLVFKTKATDKKPQINIFRAERYRLFSGKD